MSENAVDLTNSATPAGAVRRPIAAEQITLLKSAPNLLMAKRYTPAGVDGYGKAKWFEHATVRVASVQDLSRVLLNIEAKPNVCVIRGQYIGDDEALPIVREWEGYKPGRVPRKLDVFRDRPMHSLMVDIDGYRPTANAVTDPEAAIDEYIRTVLPECFQDVSYHYQLSNSAGYGDAADGSILKCHLWYWSATPYTSAQLYAWAESVPGVDRVVFQPVQVHYTAAPVFDGLPDPIAKRSGFVEGWLGHEVELTLTPEQLASVGTSLAASRARVATSAQHNDPTARLLMEKGMVRKLLPDGSMYVQCPRESEHTSKSGDSSTVYFPQFTGGYRHGSFVCQHGHCRRASQSEFLDALGVDVAADLGFTVPEPAPSGLPAVRDDPEYDPLFGPAELGAAPLSLDDIVPPGPRVPVRLKIESTNALHLTTDQANADRLMREHGGNMMVVADRWYVWDSMRWIPEESIPFNYATNLSKIVKAEADRFAEQAAEAKQEWIDAGQPKAGPEVDKLKRLIATVEALEKWSHKCEMKSTIDAGLAIVKRLASVDVEMLDKHKHLINCLSGVVNLKTGDLTPHDSALYMTKLAPVHYRPDADSSTFQDVIRKICGETDSEKPTPLSDFVNRWFGYCATGETTEQAFVVHYGNGSNGKSTVIDTVSGVLGDYVGVAAPGLLVGDAKDRHPTEVADLLGKRMVTAHESGETGALREDFIKHATGGDRIKARFMRADFFEFEPTHKLQLLTNHKPSVRGQDNGMWRRVLMMPFTRVFGTAEQIAAGEAQYLRDTSILSKLAAAPEGVFAWIVRGAVDWYQAGLNPPDLVKIASKEYRQEQDRVLQFVNENCELGRDFTANLTDPMKMGLYEAYLNWAKQSGFYSVSKPKFINELSRVVPGFAKKEGKVKTAEGPRRFLTVISGLKLLD